jgi:maltose alpha-D-glucosyltransferase/alpha-amylase
MKSCAARDVAGLVRSLDYAAMAARERVAQVTADEADRLRPALERWREAATEAFLGAYREFMVDRRLWPADAADADRVLRFFLLEKALYEIDYEMANRPAWLSVPLAGALRILRPPLPETRAPND